MVGLAAVIAVIFWVRHANCRVSVKDAFNTLFTSFPSLERFPALSKLS